ncbi:MAG: Gfo/Idh/MocA family oxidoreductase, partial [Oscillospiraceae bacterium]
MKFGIIGAGEIAHDFARAIRLCTAKEYTIELLAIASREKSKAEAFAKEHEIPRACGSYKELMEDPEVEGIYIAVPHNFHAEITKQCAEHHKAVLCEKPFVVNEAEAIDALACVRKNGVLFMEAMWTRFLPTVLKAKEWLADGKIGELQLIDASFSFY